ncbi:MAG: AI-2E family transporter [Synergistaceae bacterium]|jgi:predicted PurR-regulated permease PerM|nr:AI-2E family transporter [Synergistaceae bacterium]
MKIMLGLISLMCTIAICTVLNLASEVFIPLVIAWFLLQVFRPVIDLGRRIRLPQMLTVILVFAVLFGLCVVGIKFCTSQVVAFNHAFTLYYPKLNEITRNVLQMLQIPPESMSRINWLDILGQYLRNISEIALAISSKFVLMLVFLMFMLLEAPYLDYKIDSAFSGHNATRLKRILTSVSDQISRYLGTLALISLATGFCAWVALAAQGVELAAGWGVLTFLLNFIPTVGSIIATIPPVLMAALQFSPSYIRPIAVLLSLGVIQITIGNVITPKVVGDRLGLSPVLILLSLLLWGTIWGVPGALLSVPIASIIKIVCENFSSLKPIAVLMGTGKPSFVSEEDRKEEEQEWRKK